ncbi:MAG: RagB/SusD family nutrient uptake outer membrane protein, partial [Cyclobacteriaceae bacterium]
MKLYRIYLLILFVNLSSCGDDIFDRQPLDKISDAVVWDDPALVRAFLTDLYSRFPYRAFAVTQWHNYTDEATDSRGNSNSIAQGGASRTNDNLPYWDYVYLRDINTLLEQLETSPIDEAQKRQMEGEARVIRAVYYFEMQKRYGGVPLVDVVLDPFGSIDSRFTSRSTEEAIADFIDVELNTAADLLSDSAEPKGRINKWTALGYKARANLWSASIAKYGSLQLDGLVGIPVSRADEFFQKASAASHAVIDSERYSLYDKIPDRSENYRNLFLDPQNDEVIFKRIYDGV